MFCENILIVFFQMSFFVESVLPEVLRLKKVDLTYFIFIFIFDLFFSIFLFFYF